MPCISAAGIVSGLAWHVRLLSLDRLDGPLQSNDDLLRAIDASIMPVRE
ncbi:MAG: hypothetical protein U5R46_15125 [Gammaproteobacteria bacterium]|nr:hypothetical protein [Gammaproteobacteria bacterium]